MQTLSLTNEGRYSMFDFGNSFNKNSFIKDIDESAAKFLGRFLNIEGASYKTAFSKNSSIDDEKTITLDIQIAREVQCYGYVIADIRENDFEEIGQSFKVYTIELRNEISDYNLLLKQEKDISKKLGLYDRNIILEIV